MAEKPEEVLAFSSTSKGNSTKLLLKDTRNPRRANADIVVVNKNEAAPGALHTGKLLVQVAVN